MYLLKKREKTKKQKDLKTKEGILPKRNKKKDKEQIILKKTKSFFNKQKNFFCFLFSSILNKRYQEGIQKLLFFYSFFEL